MKHPKEEKTFLMIKPDGVKRGLSGEIILRIEKVGLKIIGLKMFKPEEDKVDNHYPKNEEWVRRLGERTKETYRKYGYNMKEEHDTEDVLEMGREVRKWLINFMTSGPVIIMAIKGIHAVEMTRKLVGDTIPSKAELGTIRGDFSIDSPISANRDHRAIYNIVHASETEEEAAHEFQHWFGDSEAVWDYQRSDEMVMFPETKEKK
ncbi:nucleoside-diphosphate kinase [Candidatus Campbellbacteria bacterium CG11_big_fil_rev_8_21_14_0_20_44_21]|uniref:nucleoside-diphosphate kinase n=1 Tax=Candidatus Campbellbacteria bacterium CG22_combo_CG10-13_8_21_14_all_43_18 TaxID=1974530 RepID=A0A2H0DWJ1_9BACT|nr:MAG: nucleoside-diphosphate kinase [Candidatus Campbellbacteria bacterium CG22_combo_CG10-13_8_21_14_all_43_18]PIR24352.1 MAG: nucleoside-diphosphate kinase [Candidatus Campbellbacteria bacterium CG11_big_fil_rev_8_21_14_0_20_44_21]